MGKNIERQEAFSGGNEERESMGRSFSMNYKQLFQISNLFG